MCDYRGERDARLVHAKRAKDKNKKDKRKEKQSAGTQSDTGASAGHGQVHLDQAHELRGSNTIQTPYALASLDRFCRQAQAVSKAQGTSRGPNA